MARRTAIILVILASLAGMVAIASGSPDSPGCTEPFDRRAWASAVDDTNGDPLFPGGGEVRQQLAMWLVRCKKLQGLSQREVWRVLGRPYGGELGRPALGDYWLTGVDLLIDDEALYVEYDRGGRVSYVRVAQT